MQTQKEHGIQRMIPLSDQSHIIPSSAPADLFSIGSSLNLFKQKANAKPEGNMQCWQACLQMEEKQFTYLPHPANNEFFDS